MRLRGWEPLNPGTQVTHPRATIFAIRNLSHLDFFVGEKNVSCIMGFLNSQDAWFWGQVFAPILGGYIDLDMSAPLQSLHITVFKFHKKL
jgi:hypothetical protein